MKQAKGTKPPPHTLLDGASLFLDFDGTLVRLAARPDAVTVEQRLRILLENLQRKLDYRVAIVSGRSAAQMLAYFGGLGLAIAGSHGAELYFADGRAERTTRIWDKRDILAEAQSLSVRHPKILIENKPFGIALHYRLAPEAALDCHDLVARLAGERGLTVQTGKQVVELMATGIDKGAAVQAFMACQPMRGKHPVFIGDDDTDEAGFRMARSLGGAGVRVGRSGTTAAEFALAGVDETLAWLESWAA